MSQYHQNMFLAKVHSGTRTIKVSLFYREFIFMNSSTIGVIIEQFFILDAIFDKTLSDSAHKCFNDKLR